MTNLPSAYIEMGFFKVPFAPNVIYDAHYMS